MSFKDHFSAHAALYAKNRPDYPPELYDYLATLTPRREVAHWFDHERFHPQVRKALRPGGALAIRTHGLAGIVAEVDAVITDFHSRVVGEFWPPERKYVDAGYRNMPFPFEPVPTSSLRLELQWDLDALIGYLGTGPAVQRYTKARRCGPLDELRDRIAPAWNSGDAVKSVVWPLYLRVGRP